MRRSEATSATRSSAGAIIVLASGVVVAAPLLSEPAQELVLVAIPASPSVAASDPVGVEFIPAVEFPAPPQLKTVKMSNVRVQMDQIHKLKRRAMAI